MQSYTKDELIDTVERECFEALANAIIMQAAKDYVKALNKKRAAENVIGEVEQFFRSQLFGTITDVDPEKLIELLQGKTEAELKKLALEG